MTTDADEMIRWIGEQLDEDAARAAAAPPGPWSEDISGSIVDADGGLVIPSVGGARDRRPVRWPEGPTAAHVLGHDPARTLREIGAKRRLLARHMPHSMGRCRVCEAPHWGVLVCDHCYGKQWPCPDVLDVASVYADRPGFQEVWREGTAHPESAGPGRGL